MVTVFQNYNDNIKEVEHYYEFLEKVDSGYANLSNVQQDKYVIDSDLLRMLKANAFLILYNLIESTIKSSLWEVFENVKNDNVPFSQMIEQLQLLWVDTKIKLEFNSKEDRVNKNILNVINAAISNSLDYYRNKKSLKFEAGSLNIATINKTFKTHGLDSVGAHDLISESFKTTTKNRNLLAHGDATFKECGKTYSFRDLRIIKCHVIRYLNKCLFVIKSFIDNKRYKVIAVPV